MTPALLALEDGSVFRGTSIGVDGQAVGEVVFNTAMTGYQEILTDPSYAGQIVTLTYPHIGNTGTQLRGRRIGARLGGGSRDPRSADSVEQLAQQMTLAQYLVAERVVAIADIDTRRLTRLIRTKGALSRLHRGRADAASTKAPRLPAARAFPGLKGIDLASEVTCRVAHQWQGGSWQLGEGYRMPAADDGYRVVAYDFGVKRNILRLLADRGCNVTVVPAKTTAAQVLELEPDGVFLSNGPGDPRAVRLRDPRHSRTGGDGRCRRSASVSAINCCRWRAARRR